MWLAFHPAPRMSPSSNLNPPHLGVSLLGTRVMILKGILVHSQCAVTEQNINSCKILIIFNWTPNELSVNITSSLGKLENYSLGSLFHFLSLFFL